MRKTKVVLVTLSVAKEDGSRDTIEQREICSCKNEHEARIILDCLRNIHYGEYNYSNNREDIKRNEQMMFTSIIN